jgi:protein SCO1
MKKKFILILIPIITLVALLLIALPYYQNQKEVEKYAFTMDSIDGKVSLSDFKGKIPIIYFGFMFCPDVCPTSLSMIAEAFSRLPKLDADKFQLIFISVDPDRDKLKDLKEYASYFYPNAIGITSDKKNLKEVSAKYGSFYAKEYLQGSKIEYSVVHTSFIYIMDKEGKIKSKLRHVSNPESIYKALIEALK